MGTIPKTLYRTDNLEYSEKNLAKIMEFEIGELHNIDILDTIYKKYGNKLSMYLKWQIKELIEEISETDEISNMYSLQLVIKDIIKLLSNIFHTKLRYGIWLCPKLQAVDYYGGDPDDIYEYPTSPVIMSDLEDEGILFAYDTLPKVIY